MVLRATGAGSVGREHQQTGSQLDVHMFRLLVLFVFVFRCDLCSPAPPSEYSVELQGVSPGW